MTNVGIPSDYLIMQRRRQEDFRAFYEDAKNKQFRMATKAEWENKTQKVIEENRLQGRVSALQAQVDDHLETRRQRCQSDQTRTRTPLSHTDRRGGARISARTRIRTERTCVRAGCEGV
jgi:hypothetical protein